MSAFGGKADIEACLRDVCGFDGRETLANFIWAFSICGRGTPPFPEHFAAADAVRRSAVDRQRSALNVRLAPKRDILQWQQCAKSGH